jgi:hypothetical protein
MLLEEEQSQLGHPRLSAIYSQPDRPQYVMLISSEEKILFAFDSGNYPKKAKIELWIGQLDKAMSANEPAISKPRIRIYFDCPQLPRRCSLDTKSIPLSSTYFGKD